MNGGSSTTEVPSRRVVILGASGQVGQVLARYLHQQGHAVVAVARRPQNAPWYTATWDGTTLGSWTTHLEGADAVINLAGSTVNTRFTPEHRKEILDSRIGATRLTAQAIRAVQTPPRVWINASAVDLYPHTVRPCPESTASTYAQTGAVDPHTPESWRFLSHVVYEWEKTLQEEVTASTRKIALRTTILLSPDKGGIFRTLLRLTRLGLGGAQGDGRQYVSWMHEIDYARAVEFLIDYTAISGPVNITSPYPVPNHEFMRTLRRAANVSIGLPAPAVAIQAASVVIKTEPVLVLKSRRSIPQVLEKAGFVWRFPSWSQAAADLVARST